MAETTDFGTFGRFNEVPLDQMNPENRKAYEYTMKLRGQVPGPHKIWVSNPTLNEVIVPVGAHYQSHSSLSKAEIEIATNVINARWLAAYSNYEHEMIAEEQGGLPPAKVQALISGLPTSFDDPRQQVVYEIESALAMPRVIPQGLYRRGADLLGDKGLTDLTMLLGWFTGVSFTLMVYDVPSNAVGLQR